MTYFEDMYEFDPTITICKICEIHETSHPLGVCFICQRKHNE